MEEVPPSGLDVGLDARLAPIGSFGWWTFEWIAAWILVIVNRVADALRRGRPLAASHLLDLLLLLALIPVPVVLVCQDVGLDARPLWSLWLHERPSCGCCCCCRGGGKYRWPR